MGEAKRRNPGQVHGKKKTPVKGLALLVLVVVLIVVAVVWLARPGAGPEIGQLPVAPEGAAPFPAQYDRIGISMGAPDAPVVVREFADYQCPACAGFASVGEQLKREYVESGQVRFVFFDFPLQDIHDNAMLAAQAARCAGDQDAYWAMHDRLFAQQTEWSDNSNAQGVFVRYGEELGLNAQRLERCLRTELHREAVEDSLTLAKRLQIRGTPTVLVDNIPLPNPSWTALKGVVERELAQE